ncbi:tetratricopeptide repeat protein, partial [Cysteiniphilum sp. 6C5]|uniref:tetratricopeptide repeat protein n=1 Tax=unclassified Cysteiniphilum TaxID=2610889 RepID=UPI003F8614CA
QLLEKALTISKKHYGDDHIEVALILHTLGWAEARLGNYADSKQLLEKALTISKKHYGDDHIEVALILYTLQQLPSSWLYRLNFPKFILFPQNDIKNY